MIRRGPIRAILAIGVAAALLSGCGSASVSLNRDRDPDDPALVDDAVSPYGFADRLGEPDVWRNEGEIRGHLTMTQIWKCSEGRYREVVWQLQETSTGETTWALIKDASREGECP
ncbi:MAG: hypothetical protein R3B81_06820 [bacterium]